jgi:hypothetical protein
MIWPRRQPDSSEGSDENQNEDEDQILPCARCMKPLTFVGERDFHEGTRLWGFALGDVGELLTGGTNLEMWVCTNCGHVEFFVPNIG